MRWLAPIALTLACATALVAQETPQEQAEKSVLEQWLQDQFSSTGRAVQVTGFSGGLATKAQIAQITIADETGIWLSIEDITLDWSQSALLSGQIDISEFSAAQITLVRPPVPVNALPDPEAAPFALPALPVSVEIGNLRADRIDIGQGFLGAPVAASLTGSLSLVEGEGRADILATRIDAAKGRFSIRADYSNANQRLGLDLDLNEAPGGVVARLLDLPGSPSVDFTVSGQGPLSDFAATIDLSTDGIDRLAGTVSIATAPQDGARRIGVDLGGDIAALFLPAYRDFFGADLTLRSLVTIAAEGAVTLDDLTLSTQALLIEGDAAFAADGWPQRLNLTGNLAAPQGAPVLLPFAGEETRIDTATLRLNYDSEAGDRWEGDLQARGLSRATVQVPDLQLAGDGTITAQGGGIAPSFTAAVIYLADGLTFADAGLSRAIGSRVSGQLRVSKTGAGPLDIARLTLAGPGITAEASGQVEGLETGFRTRADLRLRAEDFARFDQLSGLPLGGSGDLKLVGTVGPLDGTVSGRIDGATIDLATGIAQLDPLLRGAGLIGMQLDRDAQGARVTGLMLRTGAARITADIDLSSGASRAALAAELTDIGLSVPGLSGAATLDLQADQSAAGSGTATGALTIGQDRIDLTAQQSERGFDRPALVDLKARIIDLSRWSALAGRPLGGGVSGTMTGSLRPDGRAFDFDIAARTDGLRTGSDGLDKLVAGAATARLTARRPIEGGLVLDEVAIDAPNLDLTGTLVGNNGAGRANFDARIADIGLFTPDFSGPLEASGAAERTAGGDWQLTTRANGPGGTNADVSGRIGATGTLALTALGQAPLGFLNGLLGQERLAGMAQFDIAVAGPARLSSVSGTVTAQGAALSLPSLGNSVDDIGGTLRLTGEQATLDLSGRFGRGGTIALTGPIRLTAPQSADLRATIRDFSLRDPELYDTTLSGEMTLRGPLAGGAEIAGALTLGPTDLQVPSTGIGALGDLPDVAHIGETAAVRQTRARAGALESGTAGTGDGSGRAGAAYPLDITINAPSRVFIRGRGLDAELGGRLTLGGTTANILPQGQFDLIRGRLDILQQRFDLTEGTATLQGDFVPFIRLLATTTAPTGTLVTIAVEGPASAPDITFSSSPELPQDEVIAQLIFGRDLQSITPLQALQLAAAVGTLAGRGGGIVDQFREGIGLDDFDVIADEDGNAAVRAGKYLSENIYADVTIGTEGTSEINLNLDLTEGLTARGSFGDDGETSLGIFFEKDY